MRIEFSVNGIPVEFHRDSFSGAAELRLPDGIISLESPLRLGTHFSLSLTKEWTADIAGAPVTIEKIRPLLFAGFRPNKYRVFARGELIAEASGY
jgi:hypothetical protein